MEASINPSLSQWESVLYLIAAQRSSAWLPERPSPRSSRSRRNDRESRPQNRRPPASKRGRPFWERRPKAQSIAVLSDKPMAPRLPNSGIYSNPVFMAVSPVFFGVFSSHKPHILERLFCVSLFCVLFMYLEIRYITIIFILTKGGLIRLLRQYRTEK